MSQDFNGSFPSQEVKTEGIKYGVYLGIIALVLTIVSLYVLMNSADFKLSSMISGGVTIVIMIGLSAYFSILLRRIAGGFWTFSQALKGIYVMLAIAVIISGLGGAIFNLVDPEPQQIIFDKTINMTIETMEGLGVDEDIIDSQIAELEQARDTSRGFSIGQTLQSLAISLIMYFVFALVLAAILKRERPAFLNVPNTPDQDADDIAQVNS